MKSLRASTALLAERRAAQAAPRVALAARHIHTPARATPRNALNVPGPSRHHSTTAAPAAPIEPIPEIAPGDSYDIVIIGGGNAGLALACALLDQPTIRATSRILLLEGGSLDRVRSWTGLDHWENRVSSLTAENIAWLDQIGVWKHIAEDRSCPVNEMVVSFSSLASIEPADVEVWANPSRDATPAIHFPPLDGPMARMTENTNLQRALLRRIDEVGKDIVTIREGGRVGEMRLAEGDRWVGLRIGESEWVRGSVVVGADGPNSPVRHFSGIESYGHGYDTHGLVATLQHNPSALYPNNTAFQRFLPTGPIAFLPLSETASTMVWSTHPSHAAAYKRLEPDALTMLVNAGYTMHEEPLDALVQAVLLADKAGTPLPASTVSALIAELNINGDAFLTAETAILPANIESVEPKSVASFPLRLSHADTYLGDRTVLVGDAAHTTHPLAGQGLNMGLADVRVLAETWEVSKRQGGDLGAQTASLDYPRKRYPQNALLLTAVDTFHHVFRNRSGLLNWGRGIAFDLINEVGPLKKAFMGGAGAGTIDLGRGKLVDAGKRAGQTGEAGWGSTAASGLEGWLSFKSLVGTVAGVAGELAKNGLKRAASGLEKR